MATEVEEPTPDLVQTCLAALADARRPGANLYDEEIVRVVLRAATHHRRPTRAERVLAAAETFLTAVSPWPSRVLDGLADRPRPGAKATAREAYRESLTQIHDLREVVEGSRPLYLTTG